jgi:hypothetical protein
VKFITALFIVDYRLLLYLREVHNTSRMQILKRETQKM